MEYLTIIALAIFALLGPIVQQQLSDELKAWLPYLTNLALRKAISVLSKNHQERYAEEWQSHLDSLPGEMGKLVVALGFLVASCKMKPTKQRRLFASKRLVDIFTSSIALVFVFPLMLLISALVKVYSPGPIIIKYRRVGRAGKEFYCYSFRTFSFDGSLKTLPSGPYIVF